MNNPARIISFFNVELPNSSRKYQPKLFLTMRKFMQIVAKELKRFIVENRW